MDWITPSGFKVRYKNYKTRSAKHEGTITNYTTYNKRGVVKHVIQEETTIPDAKGFMCGISPNFIHSQDASHMAITIDKWNGEFGAVHDSFSTHACDVDRLLALTKQVFIDMYDCDNYFDIIRQKLTNNEDDIEQPELGNLNIGDINGSKYFFS